MVAGEAQRMGQAPRITISKDPQLHVKLRYGVNIFNPDDDVPGLGMPCLSDRCQEEKWAKIHRALTTGGDSAVAAEGCLLRLTRLCGRPIIAGKRLHHHGGQQ